MMDIDKQRGLTLLETVITLAIISFGLVAIMKLQSYLIGHSGVAKQQSEAVTLAEKKIEELRDFEQINTQSGVKAYNDIVTGTENINTSNAAYTLSWNVTDQTNPDHKVIDVTITWTNKDGITQNLNLSSIISKVDPATSGSVMGSSSAGSIQPP